MADPPNNRRPDANGYDEPLGHKKRSEAKIRWRERIMDEVLRQLSRQSIPGDHARAGGSAEGFAENSTRPPLIVLGDVQHLSLGQHPAAVGTDMHHQPQPTTYFSGTRNVSITGGLSPSICRCRQGHGTAADGSSSSKPEGVGEGSITVVDGELHNPNVHLLRYFEGAHGNTFDGGVVINAHQPAARTPVEEQTVAPTQPVFDGNNDPAATIQPDLAVFQPDPAVLQAAEVPLTPVAPSLRPHSSMASILPPSPPVHINTLVGSSHMSPSPHDYPVTPSPYRQRWEHGHGYGYHGYDAGGGTARNMSDGARPGSDGVGRHSFGLGDYSPSPAPRQTRAAAGEGNDDGPAGRMRATGSSWLLRKFKKMKRKSDEAVESNGEVEWDDEK